MDVSKFEDILYRIDHLQAAIRIIVEDKYQHEDWERGYREGRLLSLQSELRFLEGLVKHV